MLYRILLFGLKIKMSFRLATAAVQEEARNKERQIVFQQKFQEDLEQFQRTGFLEGIGEGVPRNMG